MLRALFRKTWADTAGRPLQTGLVLIVVAIATGMLAVAVTTYVSVDRAYLTRFEEGNGAHIWFSYPGYRPGEGNPSDLERIGDMKGVTATSGLIPSTSQSFPLVLADGGVDLNLIGMQSVLPDVARPILTQGRWLSSDGEREIVLEHGLAREKSIQIGDHMEILKREGSEVFEVVGLALPSDGLSYPHTSKAEAYILPTVLETMEPDHDKWAWSYGVRIQDPDSAGQFGRTVWQMYPPSQAPSFITWKANRDELNEEIRLYAVFIGVFGIFAVGVAAFVIVNVVAGNVLAQLRDMALLKSIGFTPRQLAVLLLLEHVGVGLLAAVIGGAIGYVAAPLALRVTGELMGVAASPVFDLPLMAAVVFGVSLAITATALFPSRHGGKIPIVQALTSDVSLTRRGSSRTARLATLLRLPVVGIVGFKDVFNRPLRSALTITALTVAVILAAFGLGMEATLRDIIRDPRLAGGEPYQVTVARRLGTGEMSPEEVSTLLDSRPEIDSYYGGRAFIGSTGTSGLFGKKFLVGAPGDGYATLAPYIPEGRVFTEPGEAIITRRLAEETGLGVGDSFEFVIDGEMSGDMELDGKELSLRIAGIYVDDTSEARVGSDTLRHQLGIGVDPTHYRIKVASDIDPESLRVALLRETNDRLSVTVIDNYEGNEKTAGYIRPPLYAFTVALLAVGALSVLITLLFTVRERYREFAVLKTLGFTPRQVAASVISGSILLAGIALVVGIPLGILFTRLSLNYIGVEIGVGAPFGTMPGPLGITLIVPLILLVAVLGSLFPARRASSITVSQALRFT